MTDNDTTLDQQNGDETLKKGISDYVEDWLCGKLYSEWPDWACTETLTKDTKPAKKKRAKGKTVEPCEEYSFHTPMSVQTDGRFWCIMGESKCFDYRANVNILFFALVLFFLPGVIDFVVSGGLYGLISLPVWPFFIYNLYKARTTGEDTWIVLDRHTGNVCFWRKDASQALTVPFNQVHCYWIHAYHRGGHSHHLYLMPEVCLPGEKRRWWPMTVGFANTYAQAQYFWRVITDFMAPDGRIPEVDGLIHQVRACEKLGYDIRDITERGKDIPWAVWEEVEEEMTQEAEQLRAYLRTLMKADHFDAQKIIQLYKDAPIYFRPDAMSEVTSLLTIWLRMLEENKSMPPGFYGKVEFEDYVTQANDLEQFFTPRSSLPISPKDWREALGKAG